MKDFPNLNEDKKYPLHTKTSLGDKVLIKNLTKNAELNDKEGIVITDVNEDRYGVYLIKVKRKIQIKSENIKLHTQEKDLTNEFKNEIYKSINGMYKGRALCCCKK